MCATLFMVPILGVAAAADDALVAEYKFETVTDDQTPDTSGHGDSARVHGARPVPFDIGQALLFDGDGMVDCRGGPKGLSTALAPGVVRMAECKISCSGS